jgi:hypothetical protein
VFSHPLAVIDIHSSSDTAVRIATLYQMTIRDHPLVLNGTFVIRLFTPSQLPAGCTDVRQGESGLVCRVDSAYSTFLDDFPQCPWLFRGLDDTAIRLDNLHSYLTHLSRHSDPLSDIVVRAHANLEKDVRRYVHGGAGWLVSRGYVAYHRAQNLSLAALTRRARYGQDDTAQTMVLDRIYRKSSEWDEPLFVGFRCGNCEVADVPSCPALRLCVRLRDLIAIHTFGAAGDGLRLAHLAETAPPGLLLFRDDGAQAVWLCARRHTHRVYRADDRPIVIGNATIDVNHVSL